MSEASLLAAIISWGAFQTLEKTFFDARQKMERLYLTVYLKAFTSFSRDQIADRLQTVRIQRWFIHAKQAGSFLFQHEFLSCNFTIFYCVYSSPTSYTPNNTCIWRLQRGRVRRRFRVFVRLSCAFSFRYKNNYLPIDSAPFFFYQIIFRRTYGLIINISLVFIYFVFSCYFPYGRTSLSVALSLISSFVDKLISPCFRYS